MSEDDARLDLQARTARAVEAQRLELAARLRDEIAAAGPPGREPFIRS